MTLSSPAATNKPFASLSAFAVKLRPS